MALTAGSGVYVPPKPKAVQRNTTARAATVPYGYDPLAQSGQSWQVQDPMAGLDPRGQSGADVLAEYQRAQLGPSFRRSFGYGTTSDVQGDVGMLMGLVPGNPGAIGAGASKAGFLTKILGSVKSIASGKQPAETLAEQKLMHEALDLQPGMLRQGGFLKSPSDIEAGREATRTVSGSIPGALDIYLNREQKSMPFLNKLLDYANRSKERYAPDVLAQRGAEGLVHNPNVPKVGTRGPGTLRPSSNTPEGRMLDELMSRYGDVGGAQLADRPGGFVKPLWERGDTPQGDVISRAKGATHPDNEYFDFSDKAWKGNLFDRPAPEADMSAEAYGIPFVPRQVKNANVRKAAADAESEQRTAKFWEPTYKMVSALEGAFGSPMVPAMVPNAHPELLKIMRAAMSTNKSAGGAGFPNSATAYGQDPAAFLADLLRRRIH